MTLHVRYCTLTTTSRTCLGPSPDVVQNNAVVVSARVQPLERSAEPWEGNSAYLGIRRPSNGPHGHGVRLVSRHHILGLCVHHDNVTDLGRQGQ